MCILASDSYLKVPDHVVCHHRPNVNMLRMLIGLKIARMPLPRG
jgi:hypothetical protein